MQHIIYSLNDTGKAAIIIPTGFITAQTTIERLVRKKIVDEKMLFGCISMPSNIFATTGTNVSIIFIDKSRKTDKCILIDASNLGTKVKIGKNQKTVLSKEEEKLINNTFMNLDEIEGFSKVVTNDEIKSKKYSLSAGQYFDLKLNYEELSQEQFEEKINKYKNEIEELLLVNKELLNEIKNSFGDMSL